ncbi:MAG: hypothetical protein QF701_00300 [Nitrospinota bacterium]|mgnify:CR=1 FL=1|jgi:hypothetical protein|nr:hypothetical protein [Nitrospinota bacterium]MDP7166193.1 hypothetical protein [Nitrospinota bacterium]MDP7369203.1 hypothetical protein [Nitrospinota bacterium]MDP7502904.1 hypothetical protein [Nitrospinota bacterium]MDP7664107.1 hypothetical protein [Nitrospinota bacterium]|tara:strand:+ start:92 stop:397 length:306 start_codon:yes stop_codon:yes gene_type:complete
MNTLMNTPGQRVYDPRGAVEAEARPIAARAGSLEGLRVGVLDNTKWNGRRFLEKTLSLLAAEEEMGEVTFYKKESFSKNAAPELIGRIAAESDVVVTAIGD